MMEPHVSARQVEAFDLLIDECLRQITSAARFVTFCERLSPNMEYVMEEIDIALRAFQQACNTHFMPLDMHNAREACFDAAYCAGVTLRMILRRVHYSYDDNSRS